MLDVGFQMLIASNTTNRKRYNETDQSVHPCRLATQPKTSI